MDDWSLLPSRNAESEPAPDPPSTMTTTTLPARLTRPRQAPPAGVTHPRPQPAALDPTALARQPRNQSGAKPHNPSDRAPHRDPASRTPIRNSPFHTRALDNPRPFMDDREGRDPRRKSCGPEGRLRSRPSGRSTDRSRSSQPTMGPRVASENRQTPWAIGSTPKAALGAQTPCYTSAGTPSPTGRSDAIGRAR